MSNKTKTLLQEVGMAVKKTKEEIEKNKINGDIDLEPKNYINNSKRCKKGSLLKLKKDISDFFDIKTEQWVDPIYNLFQKGNAILITHSFEHKETKAVVLVTIAGERMYMYHTNTFEEDFEILREGTIK